MRRSIGLGVVLIGCLLLPAAAVGQDDYVLGPDSQRQPDVPRGTVTQHRFTDSEIFPGTERDYAVYVPAQYDPAQPACVTVFQDGVSRTTEKGQWRVPIVFDNLIHRGEMPVSIGIFINPGVVPPAKDNAQNRYNRSFEYDAVSDRYARFLIEEMLPLVGQDYNLSDDPNDRAICGSSSGAIAAFGAAWQRPDQFRRVYSTIGTFVDLRGGNDFPDMIRKTEPKPLRVFLQDGRNDLNIYGGSWWVANQGMLSALQWAGYDVTYRWGEGGHSGKHGAAILPEAMRWLWRDYPAPIEPAWNDRHELRNFLRPDEDWQEVSRGHRFTEGPAVAPDGTVYFTDVPAGEIWRVDAKGDAERFATDLLGVVLAVGAFLLQRFLPGAARPAPAS